MSGHAALALHAFSRRAWLAAAAGALAPALARAQDDAAAMRVLMPHKTPGGGIGLERVIQPQLTARYLQKGRDDFGRVDALSPDGPRTRPVGSASHLTQPPTAYVLTAQRGGVPAWLLFGIALQESQLLFGNETLPWPWTLDVSGDARRYASYEAALEALRACLGGGVTNVDCGAMQVNWRANKALLATPDLALDPYRNLAVGAQILKTNFAATGDWPRAVGLYHTGSFDGAERRARAVRYVAGVSRRLSRHGLTLTQAANLTVKEPRHG